ncbi:MAG: hypothetical protein ACR2RL_19625 [Gammaproteobacteria bacterium]
MRAALAVVLSTALGALIVALSAFIWQGFLLIRSGVARDSMPFEMMAMDMMHLHLYALAGALAGLILGVFVAARATSRDRAFQRRMEALRSTASDPDAIIKRQRAELADEYLSRRRQGEVPEVPGNPR